jgi:hypothetical protein
LEGNGPKRGSHEPVGSLADFRIEPVHATPFLFFLAPRK